MQEIANFHPLDISWLLGYATNGYKNLSLEDGTFLRCEFVQQVSCTRIQVLKMK